MSLNKINNEVFSSSYNNINNANSNDINNNQSKVLIANTKETKRKSFIGKSVSQIGLSAIPIKTFSVDF